jgi:hypothetical protein
MMSRISVFILVLAVACLSTYASGGSVQLTSTCENSKCLVKASSSLVSVLLSIGLGLFLVFYRQQKNGLDQSKIVGVWRRFASFILDFMTVLMVITPLSALPILIAEGVYTGRFQWSFDRDFSRSTDTTYLMPGLILAFIVLYYYFYKHARLNRQTVGQYILGYSVTIGSELDGEPKHVMRVLLSFVGLCIWPISVILALLNREKVFWWDKVTNTRVFRVLAVNQSVQADQPSAGR